MEVKFMKTDPRAIAPRPSYPGDVCFELTVVKGILNNNYAEYDTGLAVQIPRGYIGLVFPMAGLSEEAATMPNSIFIIEPDERKKIRLRFRHNSGEMFQRGDKVAKLLIIPTPAVTFVRVNELPPSNRDIDDYEPRSR